MTDDMTTTRTATSDPVDAEPVTQHGNAKTRFFKPRERDRRILTCYCCRDTYLRGNFKCCAPPNGMNAHKWRERFCVKCRKCPRHCVCEERVMEKAPEDCGMTKVTSVLATRTRKGLRDLVEKADKHQVPTAERNWYETERD